MMVIIIRLQSPHSVPSSLLCTLDMHYFTRFVTPQTNKLRTIITTFQWGIWGFKGSMTCPSSPCRWVTELDSGSGLLNPMTSHWSTKILLGYRHSPLRWLATQTNITLLGLPPGKVFPLPPEINRIWRSFHQTLKTIHDLGKGAGTYQSFSRNTHVPLSTGYMAIWELNQIEWVGKKWSECSQDLSRKTRNKNKIWKLPQGESHPMTISETQNSLNSSHLQSRNSIRINSPNKQIWKLSYVTYLFNISP